MCPKWQLLESAYGKNIQVFSVVFLYSFPNTLISYISYFSSLNHMANFFWILLISSESQGILKVSRSFCFHSAAFDWFSNWETQRLEGGRRKRSEYFLLSPCLGASPEGAMSFPRPWSGQTEAPWLLSHQVPSPSLCSSSLEGSRFFSCFLFVAWSGLFDFFVFPHQCNAFLVLNFLC